MWTIISVPGSITLIWLNLTEYAIGGEIGVNAAQTANIIGALQLIIKGHELAMVASLFAIARQWIQGNLMDLESGTLLGLLGAENSLGQPTFLISKEYMAALSYGFFGSVGRRQQWSGEPARKRGVCILAVFLFAACVISSLAGPASGVLMIPRVGWFFERDLVFPNQKRSGGDYPEILLDPLLGYGTYDGRFRWNPFTPYKMDRFLDPSLAYWYGYAEHGNLTRWKDFEKESSHYHSDYFQAYINTSTTWGRFLDGNWTGGTNARTVMREDIKLNSILLRNFLNDVGLLNLTVAMSGYTGIIANFLAEFLSFTRAHKSTDALAEAHVFL